MTFNGTSCICQESFIREKGSRRCTCKAGETVVDGKCVACDDGRYKDQPGTKACSVCDADAIEGAFESIPGANKTSSASCACGFGKFAEAPNGDNPGKLNGICKVCADIELPEGVNCSKVGLTKATLPIVNGYWRSSKDDHDIVKCENLESCTHSSEEDLCAEGHTGPICSVCKDGFNKDTLGVCKSCGSAGVSVGFFALCGVLGITISYLVLRKIFGKEKLTLAAVTEGITRVTSDDKHWSQRLNTKAKILTSFYQIVSKFPSTMDIQYPDVYRIFATAVNNFFNLNSIGLIGVGYFLPRSMYSFYGSFLVTAITPIIFCLILLVATLLQCRKLNPDAARKLTASRFGIFSGFLYLIFSSTTTMSFTAFFCTTYGADDTEYLIADRSIDCNSDFHKKFKLLSYVMILVYPIGITTIYTVELWKHRAAIQNSKKREEDPTIQHLVFLWRDYRAQYWWFEIYESFRRLSFAGLLVIFKPGGAPQLCFSLILAFISSLMYSTYQPFDRTDENTLAKTSSISIFLTLLATILISLKDKFVEDYNDGFGVLLVVINIFVFVMFGFGFFIRPIFSLITKCNEKHLHDAKLKGMREEVTFSDDNSVALFIEHFKKLADSDEQEACWKAIQAKDWSGKTKKVKEWLAETGVEAEWRCVEGNGPVDQARLKFVVDADIETVLEEISSIKDRHESATGSFLYVIDKGVCQPGDSWRQIYRAMKLPWPLRQRDLVYTEHTRRDPDGDILICCRSSRELNDTTNSMSVELGRMRANMRLGGYRLRGVGCGKTEIVYIADVDLRGILAIGYFFRHIIQSYLKGVVDLHRKSAKEGYSESAFSDPPPSLPILGKALTKVAKKGGRGEGTQVDRKPNVRGVADYQKRSRWFEHRDGEEDQECE